MAGKKTQHPRQTRPKETTLQRKDSLRQRIAALERIASNLPTITSEAFQDATWFQRLLRERPVKARLIEAFVVRTEWYLRLALQRRLLEILGRDGGATVADELQLLTEVTELSTWIMSPPLPLSEDKLESELDAYAGTLGALGASSVQIARHLQEFEKLASKRPRGRPVSRRPLAVHALEMKLADPKLSWTILPRKLHVEREALRQEVMALKKVLRKYKIPF